MTSPAHLRPFMRYFVLVIVQWKDAKMCCSSLPCCFFSALLLSQLLMLRTVAVEDSVVSGLGNLEKWSTLLCTIEVLFFESNSLSAQVQVSEVCKKLSMIKWGMSNVTPEPHWGIYTKEALESDITHGSSSLFSLLPMAFPGKTHLTLPRMSYVALFAI